MSERPVLAVIGGSGLYEMPGLADSHLVDIDTPFGKPSAPIVTGLLDGKPVAFLARHGLGHTLTPSELPYRANIYALKAIGAERIVSVSACGSLREDYAPGDIVIPDQLFDFTRTRQHQRSFFGEGLVAHVSVADPFCPILSRQLYQAVETVGGPLHRGGAFITIEGPRFSTKIESNTYRSWGMSLIGMTTSPEAFLAREAEMCYAVMAHITDYDVWHVNEQPVTVDMIVTVLRHNTEKAQSAIRNLVGVLGDERPCECSTALSNALITQPAAISATARQRLGLLVDKYL